jgi:predicted nucleic acid-binding protein
LVIFDASTLILLSKIDLLQAVLEKYEGTIPETVKKEVEFKEGMDTRSIIQQVRDERLELKEDPDIKEIDKICQDFPLGKGEAAAFIIARQNNWALATDDGLAIKVCKIFDIRFITAIHFLIGAGLKEDIAMTKLELLNKYGRYSTRIIEDAEKRIMKG